MAGNDLLLSILVQASAAAAIKEFVNLNRELESTRLALEAVLGGEEQSAAAFAHLATVADRAGLSLMTMSKQFINLAAASQGTVLEGQATTDLFDAIAGTMGKLGKSTAETERVFVALGQMMAKGQIYAEEWRGQLSESLPLANAAIQKATGLTVKEFNRMMEAGQLLSADVLPALTKGLNELGVVSEEKVDSLSASLTRLENASTQLFATLGKQGANDLIEGSLDGATLATKALTVASHDLLEIIKRTGGDLADLIPGWDQVSTATGNAGDAIAGWIDQAYQASTANESISEATQAAAKAMQDDAAAALIAKARYTELMETLEKTTLAIKKQGEATVAAAQASLELARLSGDEVGILQAQAEAAAAAEQALRNNAQAKADEAAAIEKNIATLKEQLATQQDLTRTQGVATQEVANMIKAKEDKIAADERELAQIRASVETLKAQADQQTFVTEQARLDAATVGDQSAAYADLNQRMEDARATLATIAALQAEGQRAASELAQAEAELAQVSAEYEQSLASQVDGHQDLTATVTTLGDAQRAAQARVDELKAAIDRGAQADQQAAQAKLALAVATAKAADAARDLVARKQLEADNAERVTTALSQESALRVTHLRNLAREADARGDVVAASRYEQESIQAEIDALTRLDAAKQREIEIAQALVTAKQQESEIDGQRSLQEEETIARAQDLVATKEREAQAIAEALRAKQEEAAIARDTAQANRESAASAGEAAEQTRTYGDSIGDFNDRMQEGVSVQRSWAESLASAAQWTGVAIDGLGEYARVAEEAYKAARMADQAQWTYQASLGAMSTVAYTAGKGMERLAQQEVQAAVQAANLARAYDAMQAKAADLRAEFDRGDLGLAAYATHLQNLINANAALGAERLEPLRDALQDAREQMQDFTDSARDGLRQLQIEWAQLNGQQADVENLEYQRDRLDLENQVIEAQRNGNAQALAALAQQLALLDRIHQKKLSDLKAEASAQAPATGTTSAPSTAGSGAAASMGSTRSASTGSGSGGMTAPVGGTTINVNIAGVLDVNDRATLSNLGRKLSPILLDQQRRGL